LVLRSLQLPHAFYTSTYLEVIAVLHYNIHDGVIHACVLKACISSKYSKCINTIKRILYTTAMYSIYPRLLSCICDFFLFTVLHAKSLAVCVWLLLYCVTSSLPVGVKTTHNTIVRILLLLVFIA